MPGIPLPPVNAGELKKGFSDTVGGGDFGTTPSPGTPTQAARGWNDLNRAVAATLPTALVQAGAYNHATLTLLRRRSKVRR